MDNDFRFTGYNHILLENARFLRRNMTPQEKKLWFCFLKNYPVKFYRQRVIDRYIADFYCSKAHLVIELDGLQHYSDDGKEYDKIRTEILEIYKLKVIRFCNSEVDNDFSMVCRKIELSVNENMCYMNK
ncbi:MAG: endonuclease domain-containing protein [Oscillospiraceae bacterium]|nr:endonuclease domain-containing protein [Oscillospiraceae bacterium]